MNTETAATKACLLLLLIALARSEQTPETKPCQYDLMRRCNHKFRESFAPQAAFGKDFDQVYCNGLQVSGLFNTTGSSLHLLFASPDSPFKPHNIPPAVPRSLMLRKDTINYEIYMMSSGKRTILFCLSLLMLAQLQAKGETTCWTQKLWMQLF